MKFMLKNLSYLFVIVIAALFFASCILSVNAPNGSKSSGSSSSSSGSGTASTSTLASGEDFFASQTVYINLTDKTLSADNSTWEAITTEVNSTVKSATNVKVKFADDDDGNSTGLIRVNATNVTSDIAVYLTGTMTEGGVKIQTSEDFETGVYLQNVTISSTNYPCVDITKGGAASVFLIGNNTLTDGRTYGVGYGEEYSTTSGATYTDDDGNTLSCTVVKSAVAEGSDSKGTLYCKGDMTISGSGTLTVTQSYKNCIASKGILTIQGGTYDLTSTGKNGLMGDQGVQIDGGTITFNGTGSVTSSTFRKANGIKTDDDDYADSWIKINGGTLNITTYNGKGITAPYVYINGGSNTLDVTGVTNYTNDSNSRISYYDADGVYYSNQSVNFAAEGIEGENKVEVTGGVTEISSTDDGVNVSNSSSNFYISDGSLYVYAIKGDGIDSNGNIYIQGGVAVSYAPTGSEDSFDSGSKIYVSGGTIAGTSGSQMALSEYSTSGQKVLYFTGSSSSGGMGGMGGMGGPGQSSSSSKASFSAIAVKVSSSTCYAYTLPSSSFGLFVMSCPSFTSSSSSSYSVYTAPTISSSDFHGLCTTSSKLNSVSEGSSTSTPSIK